MDASELELITLNYMVAAAAAANSNLSKIHSNFGKINITTTTTGLRVNGKGHARTLLRRVIFVKMDRSVTGQDIKVSRDRTRADPFAQSHVRHPNNNNNKGLGLAGRARQNHVPPQTPYPTGSSNCTA